MTKHFLSGLLAAILWAAPCAAAVPSWVQELAKLPAGSYSAETNAEVLLDETSLTVTSADQYVAHTRRVLRILRPDGRGYAGCATFYFLGDKVLSASAWAIDPSGKDHEVKQKEFVERARFSQNLYDDLRITRTSLPATQPGSVIACEFEVRQHAWFQQQRWDYQEEIPVREARFRIQLPPGWEYKDSWSGSKASEPAQVGTNAWEWTRRAVPALNSDERMRPAFAALAERMELAYYPNEPGHQSFGTWSAIGSWYFGLARERRAVTPEIREQVRQLTAGLQDFDSRLRAVTTFLQTDVRYFGIEIGIGGWRPHFASEVFHYRYGDCKDKATLLSAMLQEAGISSEHVLVDTEHGVVRPDAPSVGFNHVIVAIQLPNSVPADAYPSSIVTSKGIRYIIFDPTDEYTPVGSIRSELQGNYGLLTLEHDSELFQIPLLAPKLSRLERHGRFRLRADGVLEGSVEEQLSGDYAAHFRQAFASQNETERAQSLERRLGGDLGGVSVRDLKVQNLDQRRQSVTLRYAISVPQYMQKSGPLLLVRPRVLGRKSLALDWKSRHYPVDLPGSSYEKDVFEIELPAGYSMEELPRPAQLDVGFASYESRMEIDGNVLRYSREYTVREPIVSPEKFEALRRLDGAITGDEQSRAILQKETGPPPGTTGASPSSL